MSDFLNEVMQTLYNLPENEVAELLYKKSDDGTLTTEFREDAKEVWLQKNAEHIQNLQKNYKPVDTTELWNKAAQETKAKEWTKIEKKIRLEFPTVDPEGKLKGEELFTAIKAEQLKQAQYDPEKVKTTSEYRALEELARQQLEEKELEVAKRIQEIESNFQKQKQWGEMSKAIRAEFMGMGPVLPSDVNKAARQVDDFVNSKFQEYEYQRQDDGRVLIMKGGVRVNNAHGNAMYLSDLVKSIGDQYYDFVKQPPAGNAGNENSTTTVRIRFKDEDDFLRQLDAEKDPTKQAALGAAWELQQQGS